MALNPIATATRTGSAAVSAGQTVRAFGGIDLLVNNASAVHRAAVVETPVKRFDLMFDINVRGTFLASQACIPHLRDSADGHILTLSPPLDLDPGWFADHTAYTMSKYAMSRTVLGWQPSWRHRTSRSTPCGRRR